MTEIALTPADQAMSLPPGSVVANDGCAWIKHARDDWFTTGNPYIPTGDWRIAEVLRMGGTVLRVGPDGKPIDLLAKAVAACNAADAEIERLNAELAAARETRTTYRWGDEVDLGTCGHCGHVHMGHAAAGICLGCPCEVRS
jgi:hypothetical protein